MIFSPQSSQSAEINKSLLCCGFISAQLCDLEHSPAKRDASTGGEIVSKQ